MLYCNCCPTYCDVVVAAAVAACTTTTASTTTCTYTSISTCSSILVWLSDGHTFSQMTDVPAAASVAYRVDSLWTSPLCKQQKRVQPRLKSWGGSSFGSQHQGACALHPAKGRAGCWVQEGVAPSCCESPGVWPPENLWKLDAKTCILVTTCCEIACVLKTVAKKLGD